MSEARERFLKQVREAVARGNRASGVPALPERGRVGYQGAGDDPVARFCQEFAAAGGQAHVVADGPAAVARVRELVTARSPARVLLGEGTFLDTLDLQGGLEGLAEVVRDGDREAFFAADVGITGVEQLIAETGSLALASRPGQPRSLSLLPPVHIAIAHRDQIVPDLFDLFAGRPEDLPANLGIITGPSKTGDIELRLVTGVHGPGEVHVVLVNPPG
jgi:L-lactate dehydrogenase complex protein LldG